MESHRENKTPSDKKTKRDAEKEKTKALKRAKKAFRKATAKGKKQIDPMYLLILTVLITAALTYSSTILYYGGWGSILGLNSKVDGLRAENENLKAQLEGRGGQITTVSEFFKFYSKGVEMVASGNDAGTTGRFYLELASDSFTESDWSTAIDYCTAARGQYSTAAETFYLGSQVFDEGTRLAPTERWSGLAGDYRDYMLESQDHAETATGACTNLEEASSNYIAAAGTTNEVLMAEYLLNAEAAEERFQELIQQEESEYDALKILLHELGISLEECLF